MGEITAGILYKNKDAEKVEDYLLKAPCRYKIRFLNETWSVFCLEDNFLQQEPTRKFLLGIGKVPLLYFFHADRHGWGYSIYFNNEIRCNVLIDYGIEYSLAKNIIFKKLPHEKDIYAVARSKWASAFKEVRQSSEYRQALAEFLSNACPDNFRLFGLEDRPISEIKSILSISWLTEGRNLHEAVNRFKEILGIREMGWISYHYPDEDFLSKKTS